MLHAEKQNGQEIAFVLPHICTVLSTGRYKNLPSQVHAEVQAIDLFSF